MLSKSEIAIAYKRIWSFLGWERVS